MPDQDYREARIIEIMELTEHPAANIFKSVWMIKVKVNSSGEEFETNLMRLLKDQATAIKVGDIVLI